MVKKKSDRKLESFRIFPVIAWGITIMFAIFVYQITQDLKEVTFQLEKQTSLRNDTLTDPLHVDTERNVNSNI